MYIFFWIWQGGVRWARHCFGWRKSSDLVAIYYYLDEEFIRGDNVDSNSPSYYDNIVLNLIGNGDLNITLPNLHTWDDIVK